MFEPLNPVDLIAALLIGGVLGFHLASAKTPPVYDDEDDES